MSVLRWQAALTTFDDTGGNEMDIELVTQEVTRLFRKCEAQLQRFGEQRSSSEADEKVRCGCGNAAPIGQTSYSIRSLPVRGLAG